MRGRKVDEFRGGINVFKQLTVVWHVGCGRAVYRIKIVKDNVFVRAGRLDNVINGKWQRAKGRVYAIGHSIGVIARALGRVLIFLHVAIVILKVWHVEKVERVDTIVAHDVLVQGVNNV